MNGGHSSTSDLAILGRNMFVGKPGYLTAAMELAEKYGQRYICLDCSQFVKPEYSVKTGLTGPKPPITLMPHMN